MVALPLQPLLVSSIDYAGLFPPASLSLDDAMTAYASYRFHAHRELLGRFILPVSKLPIFLKLLVNNGERYGARRPWRLSLLIDNPSGAILEGLEVYQSHPGLSIEAVEFPPPLFKALNDLRGLVPNGIEAFVELPLKPPLQDHLGRLKALRAMAKVRTGGVTAQAFPTLEQLAAFIAACAQARVPFKATAGLHHPFYGIYPLPDGTPVTMHGFLNLALAAALAYQYGLIEAEIESLLKATSLEAFQPWLKPILPSELLISLRQSREHFFRGFGSCSFLEPLHALQHLRLLSRSNQRETIADEIPA